MVRRISTTQLRSKLRQAQNRQRQAVRKYNQAVRNFNSKARLHNSRVRANRDRLRRELQKLEHAATQTRYISFRTSVEAVQRSYMVLEQRADANLYDDRYSRILDLSESETANSVSVINVLHGETPEPHHEHQIVSSGIDPILAQLSPEIRDRWQGALFALNPSNPDAARHFCTSSRELLTAILEQHATDREVLAKLPNCDLTQQGKPTRRSKIRFLLRRSGMADDALTNFVETDMDDIVQLFHAFNDAAHGSAGRFSQSQLQAIRARVEDAVFFLDNIISGNGSQD